MISNLLTASRLRDARSCRRLHWLKYSEGYRALFEALTLKFGTLMHRALEVWWKGWQLPEDTRLEVALAAISSDDEFEAAKARVLMIGYHLRWKDEPFDVLAVEVRFETELRNPLTGRTSQTWRLGGKIDVILRDRRDGAVCLMEHKTSAEDLSPGADYFKRLRIDGQVSVYFEGGKSLGHDIARCIYDVIGKPSQRPGNVPLVDADGAKIVVDANGQRVRTKDGKKWRQTADHELGYVLQTRPETAAEFQDRLGEVVGADPSRFFARVDVVRLEQEMKDAMLDVWQLGQELREADLNGRRPRNPEHCVTVYGTCPFFAACCGEASLEDPTLFRRITEVHPELSNPAVTEGAVQ